MPGRLAINQYKENQPVGSLLPEFLVITDVKIAKLQEPATKATIKKVKVVNKKMQATKKAQAIKM